MFYVFHHFFGLEIQSPFLCNLGPRNDSYFGQNYTFHQGFIRILDDVSVDCWSFLNSGKMLGVFWFARWSLGILKRFPQVLSGTTFTPCPRKGKSFSCYMNKQRNDKRTGPLNKNYRINEQITNQLNEQSTRSTNNQEMNEHVNKQANEQTNRPPAK